MTVCPLHDYGSFLLFHTNNKSAIFEFKVFGHLGAAECIVVLIDSAAIKLCSTLTR